MEGVSECIWIIIIASIPEMLRDLRSFTNCLCITVIRKLFRFKAPLVRFKVLLGKCELLACTYFNYRKIIEQLCCCRKVRKATQG